MSGETTVSKMAEELGTHYLTIRIIFEKSRKAYGAPQITKNLPANLKASRGHVARITKANGIRSKVTKKYKATTNSKHNLPVTDNILNRDFTAKVPNQKWVSDITYSAPIRVL